MLMAAIALCRNNNNNNNDDDDDNYAFQLMMSYRHVRDMSCLSKAVCLAHLCRVYRFDNLDNHTALHH